MHSPCGANGCKLNSAYPLNLFDSSNSIETSDLNLATRPDQCLQQHSVDQVVHGSGHSVDTCNVECCHTLLSKSSRAPSPRDPCRCMCVGCRSALLAGGRPRTRADIPPDAPPHPCPHTRPVPLPAPRLSVACRRPVHWRV
eukprot:scaffold14165_cov134-Isochrysis_galbana.AAC.4